MYDSIRHDVADSFHTCSSNLYRLVSPETVCRDLVKFLASYTEAVT